MKCAHCRRVLVISWTVETAVWKLLAKRWWSKVLCLECFIQLVSQRQKNLVILERHNFYQIIFAARRVRGSLTHSWPFKPGKRIKKGEVTHAL